MRRKRDGELVALADEIDAAEGAHVRGQERDAARRRKQALVRQGEEMLAAVSAAMAAGDLAGAQQGLQAARGVFEQAEAPAQLFEELAQMRRRISEAQALEERRAELERVRERAMHEGEAKLGQARRALEAGEGGGGLALARSSLKGAKEASVFGPAPGHRPKLGPGSHWLGEGSFTI